MKKYKDHAVVSVATFMAVFFLSSCNAGQANVNSPQQPLFVAAPGSPISVACAPGNVGVGDLNNDGKPDLVAACGEARALTVLLGMSGGNFRASTPVSVPDGPGDMVLGDVNGDRNLDLAIDSHDSYGVVLLLGNGKGGLALAPNSPVVMKDGLHPHTHGLALGDLNGDRKLDLITVNNSDNDVSIAYGDGRGGFTRAPATFPVGPSPYPLALGDVNNDGRLDIIATATATGPMRRQQLPSSFALTLLLNDGRVGLNDGRGPSNNGGRGSKDERGSSKGERSSNDGYVGFLRTELSLRTGQPWNVAVGDVNGDRKPDLIATHHDQSKLTVLLGDGAGHFSEAPNSPFDFGRSAFKVILADVNHDGRLDALAAAGEGVRVMLGDGRGNFTAAPGSPFLTGRGVWRLAVADLNGDAKLDIVTTNLESQSISILLGH